MKVVAEVMDETIAGSDTVWDVGLGYFLVKSKAKVVDTGEECELASWDLALDRAPNQSSFITLVASDHRGPQIDEDILQEGSVGYGMDAVESVPEGKVLEGLVVRFVW